MIKRALTNTGWLMGARGINAALSLIYLALATRALGLAGFGQFILVVTFAQALVGFVSYQTWQAIVRWGQTEEELPDATGFALALDGLTILAGTIAAALILWLAGDWLPVPPELRLTTFAFTMVFLVSIRSTPTGILRLHDRYARAATADSVTSVVRVFGAIAVALIAPSITAFLLVCGIRIGHGGDVLVFRTANAADFLAQYQPDPNSAARYKDVELCYWNGAFRHAADHIAAIAGAAGGRNWRRGAGGHLPRGGAIG